MSEVTLLSPPIEALPPDERPPDIAFVGTIATIDHWPTRPLQNIQGYRAAGFQVVFAQSALDGIHLHGQSAPDIEVCGVLVGHGCQDAAGEPYLLISHAIRGSAAASRSTNVTFTAETWLHIQTVMDAQHPRETIVGWYHTHPSFGIFLSDMDVFICQHFFNLAWQCAFVYDPQSGEEGNFVWRAGVPTREAVLIDDDVTPAAGRIPLIAKSEAMAATPPHLADPTGEAATSTDDRIVELLQRVRKLERRQRLLAIVLMFAMAFGAAFGAMLALTPPPISRHLLGHQRHRCRPRPEPDHCPMCNRAQPKSNDRSRKTPSNNPSPLPGLQLPEVIRAS